MPVVSKAQYKLMQLVASGKKKLNGLTKEKAKAYLKGVNISKLPSRIKKKK
jgi:hypothetical protein